MRKRINKLAKGMIDDVIPRIQKEPEWITQCIRAGEKTRGEFYIANKEDLHMKGLVYTFNTRVAVLNETFGGIRSRIVYEVDSTYLNPGDKIEDSFFLISSGGEEELPYCFQVETNPFMKDLSTAGEFGKAAERERQQALTLFEYQNFITAPFMQNLHARILYDELKGRGNRANQLEEFLVALKIKQPVMISTDAGNRSYHNPDGKIEDKVRLCRHGWGYVKIDLLTDAEFIKLEKRTITDRDFTGDFCEISYKIDPDTFFKGRHTGFITIRTQRFCEKIAVEVIKDSILSEEEKRYHRRELCSYIRLRLNYEWTLHEHPLLLNQMESVLERLHRQDSKDRLTALLLAEVWIYQKNEERAHVLLSEIEEAVLKEKEVEVWQYCFYQYLLYLIEHKDGQREKLVKLLRMNLSKPMRHDYLFLLLLKVEPGMAMTPGDLLARMHLVWREGSHSPFLYLEAWKLYRNNLSLLKRLDRFELQILNFAVRRELAEEAVAERTIQLMPANKYYSRLLYRLLTGLYRIFPRKDLLEVICGLLVKGDIRSQREFPWFDKALKGGVNLTRLYEYYLFSLPENYSRLLPKEVLLYFSYTRDMSRYCKSILYTNILEHSKPDAPIYRLYERDMERFTLEQLFESQIDSHLAVLYQRFIYKELIDRPIAKVLPSILRTYQITLHNSSMQYVVVCYEELAGEQLYSLKDGTAYVPIYFEHSVLLFQDAGGNRYAEIPYEKSPAVDCDIDELEKRCFEAYPDHPICRIRKGREILCNGIGGAEELLTLEALLSDFSLQPLFRQNIISAMIDHLYQKAKGRVELSSLENAILLSFIQEELPRNEYSHAAKILILQDRMPEAYELICKYGSEQVEAGYLTKLCTELILQPRFGQEARLLKLSWQAFAHGRFNSTLLDYLCKNFNGTCLQMCQVLMCGVEEKSETYDMEERLLAQMLFTGESKHLDPVFRLYVNRKKTRSDIVKAYFTIRCSASFADKEPLPEDVFHYLEHMLHGASDPDKMPMIYYLALTKHYSASRILSPKQKTLCETTVALLLKEKLTFPYLKKLGRHVEIPEELLPSAKGEYRGANSDQADTGMESLS